jgi:hypothetical protein
MNAIRFAKPAPWLAAPLSVSLLLLALSLSTFAPALAADSESAAAMGPFAPLAFLEGRCWSGKFPDGVKSDEHCFEWIYGGKFLRDRHQVRGGGPDYQGETIYAWDPERKAVVYWYFNSDGGFSTGSLRVEGDALVFPNERFVNEGVETFYRSVWRRTGDDRYLAVTEMQKGDAWVEAWRIEYVASAASAAAKVN